jgi:carboxy-terminal domain RNA polymerase II polypeptide A small phosphatase
MTSMQDKILILDLDETLIYSTETVLNYHEDFQVGNYFVYKRPGLDHFLSNSNSLFKLAVWTSSSSDYAYEIIKHIFPDSIQLEFVFTQKRCNFRYNPEIGENQTVKPLKKVRRQGFSIDKIVIVDDLPETFQQNYGNAILVEKFYGEKMDKELFFLLDYLKIIASVEDVRTIDKRNWRYQAMKIRSRAIADLP